MMETRTLSGHRRRWVERPRFTELLNTPVQGSAADCLKEALACLPKALEGTDARLIYTVHDELVLEAPEERVKEVARILQETIEREMSGSEESSGPSR